DELWQCFLANADSSNPAPRPSAGVETTGLDSAKLQCCYRAVTLTCQRLCLKVILYWAGKELNNLSSPFTAEEPCQLGCEGLSYCSNFNYRPTQLFRSCEVRADRAARSDVELWREGVIRLPLLDVPVLDISTCYPETWKAIACVLQIKPCHQRSHANVICKSDCIDILSKCVDYNRLPTDQTPTTLCEVLSPPGEDPPCISLKPYLGCKLGEMSHLVVPKGSYVRIPEVSHEYHCKKEQQICQCSASGKLEKCINLPCVEQKSCWLKGDKIPHNFQFYIDCNKCICLSGEIVCSQRSCPGNTELKQSTYMYTGLPCNCPDHYVPVCGINGKTYPSACLAMCAGLRDKQFDFGACSSVDPCKPNPCRHHQNKLTTYVTGNETTKGFGCSGIRCPPLPSPHCSNVIPPGACCPVCGAVVAFLFSRHQADIVVRAVQDVKPVVVQTIAEKLRYYVKVAECDVFSYLSLESEVIVTVTPITATPTFLQVETCVKEAEKIKTLVEMTSPAILTDLSLSLFLAASLEGPLSGSVSACSPAISFVYAPGLTLVILLFSLILHR
ncbi:reversion-inducing cysteine-rich protein with Kazal motifs-like, partial [Limulus polyphemus]|uniref:Reversion-inducing cysteine-rich protein with Kazal motifs-like n=1 Tax=Limulus polyphemus TaxID=6850 RepID=A0ABM1BLZ0_LIMPO